ncbi:MAG: hypothetical protein KBD53_05525 [Candidatus Omnitrophica bacterium]|nr:hypothetical protein [Candidatus Omnitrophota bacterium]
MADAKFSSKEAISHGWKMTKKYWKTIFVLVAIYVVFGGTSQNLSYFAGKYPVQPIEFKGIFDGDSDKAKQFYQYLVEAEYVNKSGDAQQKLEDASTAKDLILPPELESKRAQIFKVLNVHRYRLPIPHIIYYILAFGLGILNWLITIGLIRVHLMISRDTKPSWTDLFNNVRFLIPYVLASLCYGLIIIGGLILLVVPAIIFSLMFSMYSYLIVDKGYGPIAALKRSRVITKGSRGRLAIFGLLVILLNIGGFLCLGVGLLFTFSISSIASAYVYDRLENADEVVSPINSVAS